MSSVSVEEFTENIPSFSVQDKSCKNGLLKGNEGDQK